jgi:hypothetical protein
VVKVLGFILGIVVAAAGPAAFGVLATGGDIDLSAKETAIVYAVWALALWIAASLGAGAGALGAALTFGAMTYAVHFIPNRTTDFLNDVPGVTNGMIEGLKKAVLDGLVPVLGVITLVYAIQLIVMTVRRRTLLREEEERAEEAAEQARMAARREEAQLPGNDGPDVTPSYQPPPYQQGGSDTGEQTRVFAQRGQAVQEGGSDNPTSQFRPRTERGV